MTSCQPSVISYQPATGFRAVRTPSSRTRPEALVGSALRLSNQNLQNGYDYNALLATTADAAKPAGSPASGYQDPRYQMGDIFNPGFEGRFSIRFLF